MNVTENKLLWKTVKPFFLYKGLIREKITLIEIDEILGSNKEISKVFEIFFVNSEDPLENLVIKLKNHPSVRTILDKSPNTSFSLKTVSKKDIEKEILNLNVEKASQDSDIPIKIINPF